MRALAAGLFAVALAGDARADALSDGHAAYEAARWDEAIAAWRGAAGDGPVSADLAYDLGNAYYRSGDHARAIAWWRAARLRAPRDGDVAHNLALARGGLEGVPDPVGLPVGWLEFATVDEIAVLASLLLLAAAAGGLRARRRGRAAAPWVALGVVGGGLGVAAVHAWTVARAVPVAVIVDGPAHVRDMPFPEATGSVRLPPGTEVFVDGERDGFVLVRTDDGRRGWIPSAAASIVAPGRDPIG